MHKYSQHICIKYQAAIELLGKRWTGLILKALQAGPLRFNELTGQLQIVSDRMVSERLKELESEGIVDRRVVPEQPVRVEYCLTAKGLALGAVLQAIEHWAEQWISQEQIEQTAPDTCSI